MDAIELALKCTSLIKRSTSKIGDQCDTDIGVALHSTPDLCDTEETLDESELTLEHDSDFDDHSR